MSFSPRHLLLLGLGLPSWSPAATAPDALATVFYSGAERRAVVRQRAGLPAPENTPTSDPILQVQGVVKRDHGKSTAWINQQPLVLGQSPSAVQRTVIDDGAVTLDGRTVRVGDALDLTSRQTRPTLPAGAVTVKVAR